MAHHQNHSNSWQSISWMLWGQIKSNLPIWWRNQFLERQKTWPSHTAGHWKARDIIKFTNSLVYCLLHYLAPSISRYRIEVLLWFLNLQYCSFSKSNKDNNHSTMHSFNYSVSINWVNYCAGHCAKHLMGNDTSLSPLHTSEHRGLEKLGNLPKVTYLVGDSSSWLWTQY